MTDPDPALIASIDFALRQKVKLPRGVRWSSPLESRLAAETIARHLLRANWKIESGPPSPGHSCS